jgi:hypothetical protein
MVAISEVARYSSVTTVRSGIPAEIAKVGTRTPERSNLAEGSQSIGDRPLVDLFFKGLHQPEVERKLVAEGGCGAEKLGRAFFLALRDEGRRLGARGEDSDKIRGLRLGADDYVVKSATPTEVVETVKAVLRRAGPARSLERPIHRFGRLEVDLAAHEATVDGRLVQFTAKEFAILGLFIEHPRQVFWRTRALPEPTREPPDRRPGVGRSWRRNAQPPELKEPLRLAASDGVELKPCSGAGVKVAFGAGRLAVVPVVEAGTGRERSCPARPVNLADPEPCVCTSQRDPPRLIAGLAHTVGRVDTRRRSGNAKAGAALRGVASVIGGRDAERVSAGAPATARDVRELCLARSKGLNVRAVNRQRGGLHSTEVVRNLHDEPLRPG